MKKLVIKCIFSFLAVMIFSLNAFAQKDIDTEYQTKTIWENNRVTYNLSDGNWSFDDTNTQGLLLDKKVSSGSGNYSEYYDCGGEPAFSFGTGFEFLYEGKLIAQDIYALKFYSIYYDTKQEKFDRKDVVIDSLNKVFPDAKIVKMSDFKNGVLHLRKIPFKSLKILLVNDTPEYFYKYRFAGKNFERYDMPGLLVFKGIGTVEFYHPCEDFRSLYIKVRPY